MHCQVSVGTQRQCSRGASDPPSGAMGVWRGDPTSAHDGPWCVVRATPILHTCAALCTEARASGASHQPFPLSHTRIRGWGRMRSVVVECGGRVLLCVGNVREKKQSERGVLSVV